jgi:hypothetical protein
MHGESGYEAGAGTSAARLDDREEAPVVAPRPAAALDPATA